jgi:hypothetical protein
MKRIIRIVALAALALFATAAVASASVTVNPDGTTSIGKGDVQTALGYHNDAAFQTDAQAGKITFNYGSDVTQMIADIKCSAANIMGPDDPFDTAHNVVGSTVTPHGANVTALKNNQGKVTGYTATGITSGTPTTTSTFANWSTCPAGEHFMGWLNGPGNAFHWETTPGSSVLQVSNGVTTAELPVTPVV